MSFRASFCHPFKLEIIELGEIDKEKIIDHFKKIPWDNLLEEMNTRDDTVYYSPSFEIENQENKNGLSVSIVESKEWYIFFKRPKMIKKFFGLVKKVDNDYLTDVTGQTEQDVIDCLNALIQNNLKFLEEKIK